MRFLDREEPLEEGTASHSSTLAWRVPRTEEPGGPQSVGAPRSGTRLGGPRTPCLSCCRRLPAAAASYTGSLWSRCFAPAVRAFEACSTAVLSVLPAVQPSPRGVLGPHQPSPTGQRDAAAAAAGLPLCVFRVHGVVVRVAFRDGLLLTRCPPCVQVSPVLQRESAPLSGRVILLSTCRVLSSSVVSGSLRPCYGL